MRLVLPFPIPPHPRLPGAICRPLGSPHLEEVGRQHAVPVAVVEGQRGGKAGHGDAVLDARAHRFPPRVLDREAQAGVSRQQTLARSDGKARYRPHWRGQGSEPKKTCNAAIRLNVEESNESFGGQIPKSEKVNLSICDWFSHDRGAKPKTLTHLG